MNYCIIINDFKSGGAQKATVDLINALLAKKIKITVIVFENIIHFDLPKEINLKILEEKERKNGIFNKYFLASKLKKSWKELNKDKRFDITISRLQYTNEIVYISKIPRPYFIIDNALSEEIRKLKKENLIKGTRRLHRYKKIYEDSNLIAVSKGVRNDMKLNFYIQDQKIVTIYNPIDFKNIKELSKEKNSHNIGSNYIIHVARAIGQKRHDLLLDSWKLVNSNLKLVLLTDDTDAILKLVKERHLQSRCIVLAFSKNPYPLIKNARLLVLSSDFEGFGLVLVEAIACGTPVIATDCKFGPSEILGQKYKNSLVKPNNKFLLAKKISSAIRVNKKKMDINFDHYESSNIADQYIELANNQSILLIKTKNIGDSIILTSAISDVSKNFKHIDVICLPESKTVFEMHPRVRNIYSIPRNLRGFSKWIRYFKLWSKIKRSDYSALVQLSNDWRGALLARFFKGAFSIARSHAKRGRFWNHSFSKVIPDNTSHSTAVEIDSELLKASHLTENESPASYFLKPSEYIKQKTIAKLKQSGLSLDQKIVFFHTQSRWSFKEIPYETSSEVIDSLIKKNYQVILSGSKDDYKKNLEISSHCKFKPVILNSSSLIETVSAMKISDYVVSVDSMTIHMASALKKPVIAIFGPTDDKVWRPYKTKFEILALDKNYSSKFKCRPCLNAGCEGSKVSECLTEMPPKFITEKTLKFIKKMG
jgi:ADP-heptose:LPS heptosyltransferase/glycosyltransferase involved in cell wall biosynthesis